MARHHDLWQWAATLIGIAGMAAAIAGCASAGGSGSGVNSTSASSVSNPSSTSNAYRIGSMASEFLQSKTQIHILDDDDKVAPGCKQKRFVRAEVVSMPMVNSVGLEGVDERKWTEQWTLDRCGTPVAYDVFFTEVGDGGAYFAVIRP